MKKKKVYVALAADILHEGHINILKKAERLGDVTVGLLTDKAITSYKKLPHLNYKQREIVLKNIKYVKNLVPQETHDYVPNLIKLKPDYVVHGDDWRKGVQKKIRSNVVKTLKKWGGKLVEYSYTKNISSTIIRKKIYEKGISSDSRKSKLRRLINSKDIVRIIESHNALTGLIVENTSVFVKNKLREFDGMWSSSLTDSLSRGKPDNQSVDYSSRINGLHEIMDVTTKPVIFDADNGGRLEHISYLTKTLERNGVSAIVIEDKIGLKQNSLFDIQNKSKQDTINNFCKKIRKINSSKISDDFIIIARIESLILGKSLNDALLRAKHYSKSGADAILIHSKEKSPKEIFKFAREFKKTKYFRPLVAVPSTYSKVNESQLINEGFKIVIYANQLMRSAYPSMKKTAISILKNLRSHQIEKKIVPIKKIISLIK